MAFRGILGNFWQWVRVLTLSRCTFVTKGTNTMAMLVRTLKSDLVRQAPTGVGPEDLTLPAMVATLCCITTTVARAAACCTRLQCVLACSGRVVVVWVAAGGGCVRTQSLHRRQPSLTAAAALLPGCG